MILAIDGDDLVIRVSKQELAAMVPDLYRSPESAPTILDEDEFMSTVMDAMGTEIIVDEDEDLRMPSFVSYVYESVSDALDMDPKFVLYHTSSKQSN